MIIELDFPFHGYTKGDLIEFCFGKNAAVDSALPLETIREIQKFSNSLNGHFWYVMDYTENKIGGKLVNLKEKFFDRVAAIYLQQMPKTMAEAQARKMKCFRFNLNHDGGNERITVIAQNANVAKTMIMQAENCPESAIKEIRA